MSKKCSIWMEGSLLVCMVVISRVEIISTAGELEVANAESLRVRV